MGTTIQYQFKDNRTIVILGVKLENERKLPTIFLRLGNPSQSCMY